MCSDLSQGAGRESEPHHACYQQIPKSELVAHGFARLEVAAPHAKYYEAAFHEAPTIESALIPTGAVTCDVETPAPAKNMISEQRSATLGGDSQRSDNEILSGPVKSVRGRIRARLAWRAAM